MTTEHWQDWTCLRLPTLLVLAEHSNIDHGRIERMLRERPFTQLEFIPRSGHDLHLDQPEGWIETLWSFLSTTPLRRVQ